MRHKSLVVVVALALVAVVLGFVVREVFYKDKPAPKAPAAAEPLPEIPTPEPAAEAPFVPPMADPLFMSLPMKTWVWAETNINDGTVVTPNQAEAFSLTFAANGTFGATTDCNGVGGEYTATGAELTFANMMSTEMYCEGSQEADFVGYLSNTSGYHFTKDGALILDLKFDSGTVTFR